MKRLFLAVLLVVFLSLSIPPLRERAVPMYADGWGWVWERAEGPLAPALTPWRRMRTEAEMASVMNLFVGKRNRGEQPPDPATLPRVMERADLDPTATDYWGNPYLLEIRPDSIYLRSAAQDLQMNTPDDIVLALGYRNSFGPGRRRR